MPTIIEDLHIDDYERVVRATNDDVNLDAIIAVHNIALGPALGGCRFLEYENTEEQLNDALRLAEGMTYKNSICGLNHGGGKAVINAKAVNGIKTPELYKALGEAVELLGGIYYTAGDVGTTIEDLLHTKSVTEYCGGVKSDSGEPTAVGIYNAIKATSKFMNSTDSLDGMYISISGIGKVGSKLAKLLNNDNVHLIIADIDRSALNSLKKEIPYTEIEVTEIHKVSCNVFSPCALGNIINAGTRRQLRCNAIVGSANNQLDDIETDKWLFENNIVYAPDYLVNSGGVIAISAEIYDTLDKVDEQLEQISDRTMEILVRSKIENIPTDKVSREIAWNRINNI